MKADTTDETNRQIYLSRYPTAQFPADTPPEIKLWLDAEADWLFEACHGVQRVLELGCGGGRVLEGLAASGIDDATELHGYEFSPEVAQGARTRFAGADRAHIRIHEVDILQPFPGDEFDRVIIAFNTLGNFTSALRQRILSHAHAATRPGGLLLLSVFGAHGLDAQLGLYAARAKNLGPNWDLLRTTEHRVELANGFSSRRFTPGELEADLNASGWRPRKIEAVGAGLLATAVPVEG